MWKQRFFELSVCGDEENFSFHWESYCSSYNL
jgi:hypothetical protein